MRRNTSPSIVHRAQLTIETLSGLAIDDVAEHVSIASYHLPKIPYMLGPVQKFPGRFKLI